jgi:hypothetical protein
VKQINKTSNKESNAQKQLCETKRGRNQKRAQGHRKIGAGNELQTISPEEQRVARQR